MNQPAISVHNQGVKKFLSLLVLTALISVSHSAIAQTADAPVFRPLFNKNDLEGWVPVNIAPSTFSMEDGILKCTGKPIGEIRTEKMYQNFILEIEWRHLKPRGNAGIFIWADDITARGQPFHRGIEVQVLENAYGNTKNYTTHGDIFPIHGAKMNPINGRGGGRAFPTENRSKPSPQWNHYRIVGIDGKVSLAVNGKVVTQGENCNPRKGYICIESEGGVVEYRNGRIAELPGDEVPAEETAIANRGYRTLYTGVDFDGWKAGDGWKMNGWQIAFDEKAEPTSELTTTTSRGDFGFVFDVKTSDKSGIPLIFLRGKGGPSVSIDRKLHGDKLEEVGRWNRIDGEVRGTKVTGTINGKPFESESQSKGEATGPITIVPDGPVHFANIFAREL